MKSQRKCPKCGSKNLARLLYGLYISDEKLERDLASGKVVHAGCEDNSKRWYCHDCKTEF